MENGLADPFTPTYKTSSFKIDLRLDCFMNNPIDYFVEAASLKWNKFVELQKRELIYWQVG